MPQDPLVGKRLGKYLLVRLLGHGGIAEVYLAEHEILRNRVAVKVLPAPLARHPDLVGRFLRDARAAARLRHPHIVRIHEVGQEGGLNYFVMDYLEGSSLGERIASQGFMPENMIIRLGHQILSALAEAHKQGIIHGAIKPDNVIVDERGDAVVVDFGVAQAGVDKQAGLKGLTFSFSYFASPEQHKGRRVDSRGDIYSVGMVMYAMATGRPRPGSAHSANGQHAGPQSLRPPIQERPSLSEGLNNFILRCLQEDPAGRFSSADEALIALDTLDPEAARRAGAQTALRRDADRRKQGRSREYLEEASCHLSEEKWSAALSLAERALSLDPGSTGARRIMDQAQDEQVRDDRIMELTTRVKAHLEEGNQRMAAETLVELAGVARDKQSIINWLDKVLSRLTELDQPEAVQQRGRALQEAGLLEEAKKLYQTSLDRRPADRRMRSALEKVTQRISLEERLAEAEECLLAGDLAGAVDAYKLAVESGPEDARAHEGLSKARSRLERRGQADLLCQQAARQLEKGDTARAAENLEKALDLDPDYQPVRDLQRRLAALPSSHRTASISRLNPMAAKKIGPAKGGPARTRHSGRSRKIWLAALLGLAVVLVPLGYLGFKSNPTSQTTQVQVPPREKVAPTSKPMTQPALPKSIAQDSRPVPATTSPPAGKAVEPRDRKPPEQTESPLQRGVRLMSEGELGEAEKALHLAVKQNPQDDHALSALKRVRELRGQVLIQQGQDLLAKGELSRARQAFEQAGRLAPEDDRISQGLSSIQARLDELELQERQVRARQESTRLVEEGYRLLKSNDLEHAARAFEQAAGLDPQNTSAAQGLEQVHARQKVIEELERQAQDRSESQKITGKGRKLLDKGEIDQAEKMFAQALKLNPENPEARAGLAEVDEIRQKQLAAARRAQAEKEVARGDSMLAQGKLDQAEEAFSKALELTPELPAAQKGLEASRGQRRGIALLERAEKAARSGQFDQAEQWLQKAAAYPAVSAKAKHRLAGLGTRRRAWRQEQAKKEAREQARQARATGIADFKAGRWESAVNNLRKYLAEFPNDRSVSELLSQASKVHASYQVGALEVHSTPSARVYLDGRYVGITPLQMDKVPKGGHRVEVRIVGYKSQSRELFIKGSAVNGVSFTLVPEVNPPGGEDKKD